MKTFNKAIMMFTLVASIGIFICFAPKIARAQICAGSRLIYVVRDAKGVAIDAARTDLRYQPFLQWEVTKGNFVSNGVNAPQNIVALNGKINALAVHGMCSFREQPALKITLNDKSMNLTFHTQPLPGYNSTTYIVDSLPFQQGTFEIDVPNNLEHIPQFYPATGWNKVSATAEAVPEASYSFVRGHITDATTKKPISGVRVTLLSWLATEMGEKGTVRTDGAGQFQINGLRNDYMDGGWDIAVVAEHPDYASGYVMLYQAPDNPKARSPFKSIENAAIELTPLATVSGRVIDAATGGLPGDLDRLDVTFAYRKQGYLPGGNIQYPSGEAKTKINPDGTFTLRTAMGKNTVTSVEPWYGGSCGKCYYLATDDGREMEIDVPKDGRSGLVLKLRSSPQ